MKTLHAFTRCFLLPALLACVGSGAPAQSFSEPSTVFYGKVLGTGSAQDFLITEGALSWTILRADGSTITLNTRLFPLKDGEFSYRLDVPHAAFALGLGTVASGVPLPPSPQTHVHQLINVDGDPATLLGPAGSTFTTEQLLRTATYRLDLALGRQATDTDGDGLPDHWEDQYGLDKQNPDDAALDANGDGLSALDAYRRGLDPRDDARAPSLLTSEWLVYPNGDTAILLDTADLDSTADQIRYTLTGLPQSGSLHLRSVPAPEVVLALGDSFTQADLQQGRVLYRHQGDPADPGFFEVEVRDEDPEHPAAGGQVQLLTFTSAASVLPTLSPEEAQRLDNALLSTLGHVVLDGSAIPHPLPLSAPSAASGMPGDRGYVLVGGAAGQHLAGGSATDLLSPASGDATLHGGAEADHFRLRYLTQGRITIEDFTPDEGDVLDLSVLASSATGTLNQALRLVTVSGVPSLQVDLDGDGTGFTNLVVALPGLSAPYNDLYALVANGNLQVGTLALQPRLSLVATQPQASENGPTAGAFTITREGSLVGDLTVNLTLSGSAQNGVDYQVLPNTLLLPDGAATVEVPVQPYTDSQVEPTESVFLQLAAGAGYRLGSASQATVNIDDRLMLLRIEALEALAVKETLTPGLFLITRSELLDRDVLVRLSVSGTAANGTDYATISSYVQMGVNQTTALIQVLPKAGATLTGGMETVKLRIVADAAYRVTGSGSAEVALVERLDLLANWRARSFPGESGDLATFAAADSGATGIPHLLRYAYGMDPHSPDPADLPRASVVNGDLVLSFRKPLGVTDVLYQVSASRDLSPWGTEPLPLEPMAAPVGEADPQRVYYRVPGGGDSGFVAVEVEWAP